MTSPVVVPVSNTVGAATAANFEALSLSIGRWLNRTDLADVIPDFVRMAEAEFARDPRIRSSFQTVVVDGYTPDGEIASCLVGSEMCIRDRFCRAFVATLLKQEPG